MTMLTDVTVPLGTRSYSVHVGPDAFQLLPEIVARLSPSTVVIITDTVVNGIYGERVEALLDHDRDVIRLEVDEGESVKSLSTAGMLLRQLADVRVKRGDLIVSLGGGVITDLGGFVASVYQRGVRALHLPTTLLGQVDAAIGGKTGVNLPNGKNLVGTFYQPVAVISDTRVLATLPEREFTSGVAEVIKYGLCFDEWLLGTLGSACLSASHARLDEVITTCVGIKASVVSKDETDADARLVLNYGHTLGHAIEAATGYSRYTHGEAVSIGMVFAAELAHSLQMLDAEGVEKHRTLLEGNGLPVAGSFDIEKVREAMRYDKKAGVTDRWVLLEAIGRPVVSEGLPDEHIRACLDKVLSR